MKKILAVAAILLAGQCLAQTTTISFPFGGQTRSLILHLPAGYSAMQQYPLVFNLHGYQSNAQQQMIYSGMNATSDMYKFIVVYPEGLNAQWNSGWTGVYGSGTDDVGFISALIDYMDQNYSIDTDRVYACGMSNGGYQVNRMACELSNRIAAVASVTGLMTDSTFAYCTPQRTVPMMQVHGTADPIVPASGPPLSLSEQETISFWVQQNACNSNAQSTAVPNTVIADGCWATKFVYTNCDNGTENWRYVIQNGGHTWPGGIPIPAFGNTCQDFDASEEIWLFFSKYSIQGALGNEEISAADAQVIYPNPTQGLLFIGSTAGERMQLLDANGAVLRNIVSSGAAHTIDLSEFKPGIYWLRRESGHSEKVVRF